MHLAWPGRSLAAEAQQVEGGVHERQPFRTERHVLVGDVEVQVRATRVAGVADLAEHLAAPHLLADLDPRAPGQKVGVQRVAALSDVENDVVADGGGQVEVSGARGRAGTGRRSGPGGTGTRISKGGGKGRSDWAAVGVAGNASSAEAARDVEAMTGHR